MSWAYEHPYDRIVIGAGTTAAVYLSFFPPREREKVGVIGTPEPWGGRGQHRMGQPAHLLMLPLEEPVRPDGFAPHSGATGQPARDRSPTEPFLRSDVYAQQIPLRQGLRGKGTFGGNGYRASKYRHAWVESVRWVGDRFKVSYKYGEQNSNLIKHHYAREVIVATGPGPAQHNRKLTTAAPPQGVYYTGDGYLNDSVQVRGPVVAVEGGSATAAWAVEKALLGGAQHVFWFTRPNPPDSLEKRFAAAFPAGDRNVWLKQQPNISRLVCQLDQVAWTNQCSGGQHRLRLKFTEGHEFFVDQYVAAVGATETAEFLGDLRNEMKPVLDEDGHLHPSGTAILAYRGRTKPFWIVGAGVFKVTKGRDLGQEVFERPWANPQGYSRGNEYLPTAARPPEGIPTIIASIAALTRYAGGGSSRWLDINLGNFSDLDAHFSMGIGRAFAAVALASLPEDYSLEKVARFITDQVIGTRIMRSSPYGIKVEEMVELYRQLRAARLTDGTHLKTLVDAYYSPR